MKRKTTKPVVYKLTAKNLSSLGGPMGSERVTTIFSEYFYDMDKAKDRAEKHYNGRINSCGLKIKWTGGKKSITSEDMGWVMYTIHKIKIQ